MEPFYYSKMNKMQQAAYHAICQGGLQMEKEIQVPRMSGEELYNVFFQMRLDHPEIFWALLSGIAKHSVSTGIFV